ncbi:MAG: hypothetical protein ACTSSO_08595, partial [Candidatus Hodarchaeales archaeon]
VFMPWGISELQCWSNPKELMGIHREKAEGTIKWWRRILADKRYPCFIYDPFEGSIFNENDEELNQDKVIELIKRFGVLMPVEDDCPFEELAR